MYKLEFTLKQHTPLIHFQHDHNGATLRATEVKPKLDRFLIEKLQLTDSETVNGKEKFFPKKEYESWFNNKEKLSLDYKMRIIAENRRKEYDDLINLKITTRQNRQTREDEEVLKPTNLPTFFGNMMNIEEYKSGEKKEKKVTYYESIKITVTAFNDNLIEKIIDHINGFFAVTNFGTRQSKGFGSFYLHPEDPIYTPFPEYNFQYKTTIKAENIREVFEKIEWFYKALRGGINHKRPKKENGRNVYKEGLMIMEDLFYMKPIIFLYFKSKDVQWEKKTIKEKFFNNDNLDYRRNYIYKGLKTQIDDRENCDVLSASFETKKIIKDLLGLSSEEQWKSYNATISKSETETDDQGKVKYKDGRPMKKKKAEVERYKSPLHIIPIKKEKGNYNLYFYFDEKISIKGKWFNIDNTKNSKDNPFPLQVAESFSLLDLFDFINSEKFDVSEHYIQYSHDKKTNSIKNSLDEVFKNLKKIESE